MKLLDLTLDTPEENLALDEALLETAEQTGQPAEVLRLWESAQIAVVLGRSSRVADEVDCGYCRRHGIPILRRTSGGSSVVIGPGCLMYALVLSCELRPEMRAVGEAHRAVLGALSGALGALVPGVGIQGISDLAIGDRKFSGNSIRAKRKHLLYHGTLLYGFPLAQISACLRLPARQPDYRRGRDHERFLINLPATGIQLRTALADAWQAREPLPRWPQSTMRKLIEAKYSKRAWNLRF